MGRFVSGGKRSRALSGYTGLSQTQRGLHAIEKHRMHIGRTTFADQLTRRLGVIQQGLPPGLRAGFGRNVLMKGEYIGPEAIVETNQLIEGRVVAITAHSLTLYSLKPACTRRM